jgi:hypothetical protein
MNLEKIVTMANSTVRLQFLAMERSLRSVGCQLPLLVIPFDDKRFDLPPNATWWEIPEISRWLQEVKAHPLMRKYQCFTIANYHFTDTDIIFLRNPEEVLADESGFITSCSCWRSQLTTYTESSLKVLKSKSSLWQKNVFNSGQFACNKILYDIPTLKAICEDVNNIEACLKYERHEQPGVNLLVNLADIEIHNLSLHPTYMESTWAGDYLDETYTRFWNDEKRKPYLIHWAGMYLNIYRPIDELFLNFLTPEEKEEWSQYIKKKYQKKPPKYGVLQPLAIKLKRAYQALTSS